MTNSMPPDSARESQARRVGAYAKLLANYASDDAIIDAGEAAELLFVRGLAFCATSDADGYITHSQLLRYVGAGMKNAARRADRLVLVGVWERVDGGYLVRSWTKIHQTAAEKGRKLKADRERKKLKPLDSKTPSARNPEGIPNKGAPDSLSMTEQLTEQRHDRDTTEQNPSVGGERPEPLRAVTASNPPTCSTHPNGDHDGPCAGCKRRREYMDRLEAEHRKSLAADAANCPDCHGSNWLEDADGKPAGRCHHRRTA